MHCFPHLIHICRFGGPTNWFQKENVTMITRSVYLGLTYLDLFPLAPYYSIYHPSYQANICNFLKDLHSFSRIIWFIVHLRGHKRKEKKKQITGHLKRKRWKSILFRRGLTSSRSAQSYTHASASCRAHSTQLTNRGSRKRRRIRRTMTIGALLYLFVAHHPFLQLSFRCTRFSMLPCTPRFYVGFAQDFVPAAAGGAIHLTGSPPFSISERRKN
jgi:hypothetical protein